MSTGSVCHCKISYDIEAMAGEQFTREKSRCLEWLGENCLEGRIVAGELLTDNVSSKEVENEEEK